MSPLNCISPREMPFNTMRKYYIKSSMEASAIFRGSRVTLRETRNPHEWFDRFNNGTHFDAYDEKR